MHAQPFEKQILSFLDILSLDIDTHHGSRVVTLCFPYNRALIAEVKKLPLARWSASKRVWLLPFDAQVIETIKSSLGHIVQIDDTQAREKAKQLQRNEYVEHMYSPKLEAYADWLKSKRYSANTIKTYTDAVRIFLKYMDGKPVNDLTPGDVIRFNKEYILKNGYSTSYQNQVVNGLKLFFRTVENRKMAIDEIHRPRRERKLPAVLSKEEVKQILEAPTNLKHKVMLSLIYACGLRRGEMLRLTPADILSDRKLLHIKQSKGKKDRIVPLSDRLLDMLRAYYKTYKPKMWLFEGQAEGEPYSEKSLESVLKQSVYKARITKPVTLHWLRHSYATHLLESGTDLRYIQELLGHSSSRTTEIYTHVSQKNIQQIRSPFDDL